MTNVIADPASATNGVNQPLCWVVLENLLHCFCASGEVLRITHLYLPYSYGTHAHTLLEKLTATGWERIHNVQFKQSDEPRNLMTIEESVTKVQEHANQLAASGKLGELGTASKDSMAPAPELTLPWETVVGLDHCVLPGLGVLRIAFQYLPYSYGTAAYAYLNLLTKTGWELLGHLQFMQRGKDLMSATEAKLRLKQYAESLYGNESPAKSFKQPAAAIATDDELIWSDSHGEERCTVCGDTTLRLFCEWLPYSYGTEAYVLLSFVPKSRSDSDVRDARLHTSQWMFNGDHPQFDGHKNEASAQAAAVSSAKAYAKWLFASSHVIR